MSETASVGGAVSFEDTTVLGDVEAVALERIVTGGPWDPAWGGGFVPTSITLMGGSAGAGKTTILLQLASIFVDKTGKASWYLSAEQSSGELRITANRLALSHIDRIRVLKKFGAGAELDEELFKKDPPGMLILDSISALCGKDIHAAISICKRYKQYAIKYNAPAFLISHMTKEGDFAGLMALQHEVDTLTTLFPEEDGGRHLKSWKNRFGPTHAEYRMLMTERGFVAAPSAGDERKRPGLLLPPGLDMEVETAQQIEREAPQGVPFDLRKLLKRLGRLEIAVAELQPKKPPMAKPARAEAVEGEALKKGRAPMKRDTSKTSSRSMASKTLSRREVR